LRYHHIDAREFANRGDFWNAYFKYEDTASPSQRAAMKQFLHAHDESANQSQGHVAAAYYAGLDLRDEARDLFQRVLELLGLSDRLLQDIMKGHVLALHKLLRKQLSKSRLPAAYLAAAIGEWPMKDMSDVFQMGMDIYFLARLFTRFDTTKLPRGPERCRGLEFRQVRNAIVYCGASHAEFYIDFLDKFFHASATFGIQRVTRREHKLPPQCIQLAPEFDYFQ
jgi:hypothetical protein